ncbi:MAG: SDR family oxidoreductase [Gemmatimonadaceae bacterium]
MMAHVLLVTGATGVIGRPLVEALCAEADVERLYALTHTASLDFVDDRLTSVAGDVTAGPDLGLDASVAQDIAAELTGIVHLAADTRFGATIDNARRTNVGGTRNALAFAKRCAELDRVMCLSTVHVAGKRTGHIHEEELSHTAGFVNAYEASKYEVEQELRRRMEDLPIAVCRLSTVIGDSRTGQISKLGAIHQALRFMYAGLAPMVPGTEDSPVDLIALDYAVAGIVTLALRDFVAGRTWHLCAGRDTLTTGELLDLTMQTFLECRPGWRKRAIERPLLADLATFELFRRSLDEVADSALHTSLGVVAHFAPQLAFPKQFDDRRCQAALTNRSLTRPHARDCLPRVVRHLIETKWAPQAAHPVAVEQ